MRALILVAILSIITFTYPITSYADSERIRNQISERLDQAKDLGRHNVDIEVRWGTVTLTGEVASPSARQRIEDIVTTVLGVDKVVNQLQVQGANPVVSKSDAVAQRIAQRAQREIRDERFTLQVEERPGEVVLKGGTDTLAAAQIIRVIAEQEAPGMQVRNQLQVREELLTNDQLRQRVLQALASESLIRSEDLDIQANNGVVTIKGVRPNHREVDRILSVVVMVEGVKDVKSQLRLE